MADRDPTGRSPHPLDAFRARVDLARAIADAAPFGVFVDDTSSGCVYVNAAYEALFGRPADQLIGFGWVPCVHPDDGARLQAEVERFERTGAPARIRHRIVRPDGEVVWVQADVRALRSGGERLGSVVTLHDVSHEEQDRASDLARQRAEVLGRLAAGVAHDFNNLLTTILGGAELIRMREGVDAADRPLLSAISDAVEHARQVTNQLLTLGRARVERPRPLRVDEELRRLQPLLLRTLGERLRVDVGFGAGEAIVHLDPAQLGQIILNLALNARDAVAPGGTLRLRSSVERPPADARLGRHDPERSYVRVRVEDDGCGMDEPTQRSMFEAFFTTKPEGRGTGLGLATVRDIVERAHGLIDVESAPGKGTRFDVFLPESHEEALDAALAPLTGDPARPDGRRLVLFVDDNDGVRLTMSHALSRYGYDVVPARSAAEALERAARKPVDALVTDVILPDGSGPDLAKRIEATSESGRLPAVFTSGFAGEARRRIDLTRRRNELLAKPYSPQSLVRTLARVLARPAPSAGCR